ncbi:hypothetical protein KUCAC02_022331, partial [Chaenocephalus aceratus]
SPLLMAVQPSLSLCCADTPDRGGCSPHNTPCAFTRQGSRGTTAVGGIQAHTLTGNMSSPFPYSGGLNMGSKDLQGSLRGFQGSWAAWRAGARHRRTGVRMPGLATDVKPAFAKGHLGEADGSMSTPQSPPSPSTTAGSLLNPPQGVG